MQNRTAPIQPKLFIKNRQKLNALIPQGSIAILHSNDLMPTNADGVMSFKQNSDLFYLTGVDQEETILLLFPSAQDHSLREILFLKETSEDIAIWEGAKLTKDEATKSTGIKTIKWTSEFERTLKSLAAQADSFHLLTNEHARSTSEVETRNDRQLAQLKESYPLHQFNRLSPLLTSLRMIKEDEEIEHIKHAVDITEASFRRILKFIKPGVGEWEIEAEYLHEYIRSGTKGFAYQPIIGSGKNACVLHYIQNNARCQDGELILMDVATLSQEWNADMTRTIPVNGKFTPRQRDVYEAVLRVLKCCRDELLRPGILLKDYQKPPSP